MKLLTHFLIVTLTTVNAMNLPNLAASEAAIVRDIEPFLFNEFSLAAHGPVQYVFYNHDWKLKDTKALLKYFETEEFKEILKEEGNALELYDYWSSSKPANSNPIILEKLREFAKNTFPDEILHPSFILEFEEAHPNTIDLLLKSPAFKRF
jgi:hypothetical protein